MHLANLMALAPPPAEPIMARGDWGRIEGQIGRSLPADFKALIATYGSGSFGEFLNPINPLRDGGIGFEWADQHILAHERGLRRDSPRSYALPIYPEPGGILPWATTDNGDTLFWLTWGDPDGWGVLHQEARGDDRVLYPFRAVEFLARWLAGELCGPLLPDLGGDPACVFFRPPRERETATIYFDHAEETFERRFAALLTHFGPARVARRGTDTQRHFFLGPANDAATYTELGGGFGAWLSMLFVVEEADRFHDLIRRIPTQLGWPIRHVHASRRLGWTDIARSEKPSRSDLR